MTDPTAEFRLVTEQGFPHGLMCPECHRVIKVGQPFQTVVVGMYEDGSELGRIQCVYCPAEGLTPTEEG